MTRTESPPGITRSLDTDQPVLSTFDDTGGRIRFDHDTGAGVGTAAHAAAAFRPS